MKRHHSRLAHHLPLIIGFALLAMGIPAKAQLITSQTLRVSAAPAPWVELDADPLREPLVTLERSSTGQISLFVRIFSRTSGYVEQDNLLVIPFSLKGPQPVDVLISSVFAPGEILVLDSARRITEFRPGLDASGRITLTAEPAFVGPIGDASLGDATVLGEAPNPADTDNPFLGIGTTLGNVVVVNPWTDPDPQPVVIRAASTPILDLGPLTQVGYFAMGAVFRDARGVSHLAGVNPDADINTRGLQPAVTFDLTDPRSTGLIDFGSEILSRTSAPWVDPDTQPIVAANGTREIAGLSLPAKPGFGGSLGIIWTDPDTQPIRQVIFGSLTYLPVGGTGVLYNRRFTREEGFVGRIWTIAGASMIVAPETVNLRARGRTVEVAIECDTNRAALIDWSTLILTVDGVAGAVNGTRGSLPRLFDVDGDTNVDLLAKFDRSLLQRLLARTTGDEQVLRCTWQYRDGAVGSASALVRVIR